MFEGVVETAGETDWTNSFTRIVEDVECIATAMGPACDDFDESATAGSNGNTEKRQQAKGIAYDDIEECELATGLPVVEELYRTSNTRFHQV